MPGDQAGPDLPLGRGVVRLRPSRPSCGPAPPWARRQTSRPWLRDPASVEAYEAKQRELGDSPSDETLIDARLFPTRRKVRLRVYQTNSTHKSMSAIRQGSMLLVKDVDFHTVEAQFREAVFTHASTSPNQQLIASLDVARRQMELEGYGLVMNAIEIALRIREAINTHPLISRYFRVLGADDDPVRVPAVGVQGLPRAGDHLGTWSTPCARTSSISTRRA